jgi:subtilisin family serine protease
MPKFSTTGMLLSVLVTGQALVGQVVDAPQQEKGNYIVVLNSEADPGEIVKAHGLKAHGIYRAGFKGFAAQVSAGGLSALQQDPQVAFIEPDQQVLAVDTGQVVPTGVHRIGGGTGAAGQIAPAGAVSQVNVAILDTGIDYTHPDLNVVQHISFCDSGDGADLVSGHGTHVAGIVGALDNNIGVVGVAPGASLWAVKVLNDAGVGDISNILLGFDYILQHASQIAVVNMSWGSYAKSDALRLAIQQCVAQGIVCVAAAGNDATDVYGVDGVFDSGDDFIPASYPEVAAVSALADSDGLPGGLGLTTAFGSDDTLATFSNFSASVAWGSPVQSPGGAIDLAAPGVGILSTFPNGTYAMLSGTSVSAPHVTGAAALYVAAHGRPATANGVYGLRQALIRASQPQSQWGPAATQDRDANPEGLVAVGPVGVPSAVPALNLLLNTDAAEYANHDKINITVKTTSWNNGTAIAGASVRIGVTTSSGSTSQLRATTDTNGMAKLSCTVNAKHDGYGVWTMRASASKSGFSIGSASTTFMVVR